MSPPKPAWMDQVPRTLLIAYRELPPERLARLRALAPDFEIMAFPFPPADGDPTPSPALRAALAQAEIEFGYVIPQNPAVEAPRLRWIEYPAVGMERFDSPALRQSGIQITNAAGITAPAIAEYALGAMLWFAKRLAALQPLRRERRFERLLTSTLAGKTLLIIGLGAIGQQAARLAKAFDMRVLAIRRTPATHLSPHVDQLLTPDNLLLALGEADYVLLCLPLTAETRRLIDARALAALRPTAVLINVARGEIVDEAALIDALQAGRLAGAALDVFEQEPLAPESPLWTLDNVLLTPHSAGYVEGRAERAYDRFEANLRRYLAGEPLQNQVDLQRGY